MTTAAFSCTPRKIPKLYHHKPSGQGYVLLNGRAVYLGKFHLPQTHQKYHRMMAEMAIQGGQPPVEPALLTVTELIARYVAYAEQYYRSPDGRVSSELANTTLALRPVRELYGATRAAEFGPLALKAVRQKMIDLSWCRSNINKQVRRIKTVFKWASSEELIPGHVFHTLQTVAGLRKGRTGAREPDPIQPVAEELIDAIRPFVSRQVWAVIQLQLLTAARPSEILAMRPVDVDRSGSIWAYRPKEHKTAHHGHDRNIYIGPRGQAVLSPFLLRDQNAYCFSAAEAEEDRHRVAEAARQTPLSCGNRRGVPKPRKTNRTVGDRYDRDAYRRAIARACDHAFLPPEPLAWRTDETEKEWQARLTVEQKKELRTWQRLHRWHPHQLRHNAATHLRSEFGIETARIILGHRSAAVTTIYAEADQQKAIEAMRKIG